MVNKDIWNPFQLCHHLAIGLKTQPLESLRSSPFCHVKNTVTMIVFSLSMKVNTVIFLAFLIKKTNNCVDISNHKAFYEVRGG